MAIGRVEKVENNFATVSIKRQDMCGECHACEMTGEIKECTIKCRNLCHSQVGEIVQIEAAQPAFLKATGIMYGVPLIGFILGLSLGTLVPCSVDTNLREIVMAILGIVGVISGLIWIKRRDYNKKYDNLLPDIVKVIK